MNNINNDVFDCYSKRLTRFLILCGFRYEESRKNKNHNKYWRFIIDTNNKEDFEFALQKWDEIKERFPYDKATQISIN